MSFPPAQAGPGMPPSNATGAQEASALRKVMWFAIVQLVGLVAGWLGAYYVFSTVFFNTTMLNLGPNPTPADVSNALGPLFQAVSYVIPLGIGVGLVGLIILTMGFRELAAIDRPRFSISSSFMIIMIVGLAVVGGGAFYLVAGIPGMIANVPATGGNPSSAFWSQMGSLVAAFGLLAVGGILALVGLIGGLILGLWRVGARYDQTIVKVGAIFEVIPFLSLVAPILILVGANEAKNMVLRRP